MVEYKRGMRVALNSKPAGYENSFWFQRGRVATIQRSYDLEHQCHPVMGCPFEVIRHDKLGGWYHLYHAGDNVTLFVKKDQMEYFIITTNLNLNAIWEELNA